MSVFGNGRVNPCRIATLHETATRNSPPTYYCETGSSALAPLTLRSKSDTLETRTKLTSHSALVLGGLPRLSFPISLHEEW